MAGSASRICSSCSRIHIDRHLSLNPMRNRSHYTSASVLQVPSHEALQQRYPARGKRRLAGICKLIMLEPATSADWPVVSGYALLIARSGRIKQDAYAHAEARAALFDHVPPAVKVVGPLHGPVAVGRRPPRPAAPASSNAPVGADIELRSGCGGVLGCIGCLNALPLPPRHLPLQNGHGLQTPINLTSQQQ